MRRIVVLSLVISLVACAKKISKLDLQQLNGYWEIEEVVFPNGNVKKYKINTSVDYIQLANTTGFRKKVQPQLDGTYKVTDDAESFTISKNESVFTINYKNNLSEWKEELIRISEDRFSVVNEEGITYRYKRFTPINANL